VKLLSPKKGKLCTSEGVQMSKLLFCQCIMVATTTTTMPPKLNNILLKEIPNIAQKKKAQITNPRRTMQT
jgi:hypothetical protein